MGPATEYGVLGLIALAAFAYLLFFLMHPERL